MDKNDLILEVLKDMESRINAGLKATSLQEREDLKQEIYTRLVKVTYDMEPVSLWEFKQHFDEEQKKIDKDGC
ncbi:hypothetical protein [Virgibacillus sp. CBA3643]|uniref:hypothetical protein n=1 Tax=Virgibacillus sp. CBA3643 TaxID=2942278 RepID=UPI0035A2F586